MRTANLSKVAYVLIFFLMSAMHAQSGDPCRAENISSPAEVRQLIEKGFDINAGDEYQRTLLHYAAYCGKTDVAVLLIQKGANINARDRNGETAWVLAVKGGMAETAAVLKNSGAKEEYGALRWSGQYSKVKETQTLIITNQSLWRAFWKNFFHNNPPVDPDFSRHIAVCIFLGTRPTGGYGIEFGAPREEDGKMIIPFSERKPTGFVTQALTNPFAVKIFEKKKDISIVVKKEDIIREDH